MIYISQLVSDLSAAQSVQQYVADLEMEKRTSGGLSLS